MDTEINYKEKWIEKIKGQLTFHSLRINIKIDPIVTIEFIIHIRVNL